MREKDSSSSITVTDTIGTQFVSASFRFIASLSFEQLYLCCSFAFVFHAGTSFFNTQLLPWHTCFFKNESSGSLLRLPLGVSYIFSINRKEGQRRRQRWKEKKRRRRRLLRKQKQPQPSAKTKARNKKQRIAQVSHLLVPSSSRVKTKTNCMVDVDVFTEKR